MARPATSTRPSAVTPPDQAVAGLDRPPLIRPAISDLQDSKIVEVWKLGFTVPDVIGLWVGEGDLPTPSFICDAAVASLQAGETFYTPKRGIAELHQALIDYHRDLYGVRLAAERIAVTSAGMNAMMLVMQAIISPGDNVVVVTPVWPNLAATIEIMNGEVRELALRSTPAGWQLDLDRLFAACDRRTRAIYIASPGNPTGWVMPTDLAPIFDKLMEYNTSGGQTFLQRGCVAAIRQGEGFVAETVDRYRAARDLVVQRLSAMRKVKVTRPEAAFYLMLHVDGMEDALHFAKRLVHETRVGLAPGSAFGAGGEGFLRLCFASSLPRLSEAMDRLQKVLD